MTKKKVLSKINPVFLEGIAHRGLHNGDFTENGLKAFENAINHGVAFEYDIHLTKDNELVVCHDESLKRTTGKEGIIEDLTLKEIKENYRLLDGGEIPTLQEVINLMKRHPCIVLWQFLWQIFTCLNYHIAVLLTEETTTLLTLENIIEDLLFLGIQHIVSKRRFLFYGIDITSQALYCRSQFHNIIIATL